MNEMRGNFIAFAGWQNCCSPGISSIVGYSEVLQDLVSMFSISDNGKQWYLNSGSVGYDWWHILRTSDMTCVGGSEDRMELDGLLNMEFQAPGSE